MAKSNKPGKEFQDIIAEIQKQLSGDSVIKSPDYIMGVITRIKREVDVSIRSKIGLYDFLTIIECRDHERPVNVTYIEQLISKRDDVKANKVIVISRNGFTQTANDLARIKGIDLFRFSDSKDLNWNEFISASVVTIHQKNTTYLV